MRPFIAMSVCLAASLSLPVSAATPSFDCRKAGNDVERTICRDAELAGLDRTLAELYRTVLARSLPSDQRALKRDQQAWLAGRNDCSGYSDQRGCIKAEYESRIRDLTDY